MKVDLKTRIKMWCKPNSKQKTYLATLSALIGGTLIYTAWQFIIPTQLDLPKSSALIQVLLISFSAIFTFIGYTIQEEDGSK